MSSTKFQSPEWYVYINSSREEIKWKEALGSTSKLVEVQNRPASSEDILIWYQGKVSWVLNRPARKWAMLGKRDGEQTLAHI